MDRKWISKTTSGVFSYLYNQITGENESVRTNSSRSALSKGMWVTDLPTNNYKPLEASHGARDIAKKYKREQDLEEKIASLREQCNAKNKEIVCLQDKLSELQKNGEKKASDLAKKLEDKEHLMKKAKKFVSVTKGKLLKKEAEVEELSKELQSFKEREREFNLTKVSLEDHVKNVQERLDEKLKQLQEKDKEWKQEKGNQLMEINTLERKLSSSTDDLKNAVCENNKIKRILNRSKEREEELTKLNASLDDHGKELQEKLRKVNCQLLEKEKVCNEEKRNLSLEIVELKDKLYSTKAELESAVSNNKEMTEILNKCQEREQKLKMTNVSLEDCAKELQKRLDEMSNTLQEKERTCNEEKETLSCKMNALENKLSATNDELRTALSKNDENTALLESYRGRKQDFERTNTSLKLQVTKLQEKLDEMSQQLQKNEEMKRKTEEQLQKDIFALKIKLSSTNTKSEEILQCKNEIGALLNISRATSVHRKDHFTPDEQLVIRYAKPDQAKESKNSVTVNPLAFIAEQCDIPPPPPIIINSASRQHVQIQQGGGLCGNRHRINPFSMKATRAAQGESNIKLRPASPFIPVCNTISRQMDQHACTGADDHWTEDTRVNLFSSIKSQGFCSKFLKWFGF